MATIIYTHTDEAPLLATYSFLPIVSAYAHKAGVEIETRDISLAGRILAQFGLADDALTELGELTERPEANIVKLPNISASVPQLKAAIKELQAKGYALPDYPETPATLAEAELRAKYGKAIGSVVNPVLRQGNSDRRAPLPVKAYARKHPHVNKPFAAGSKTSVATMGDHDFRANEKSVTLPADDTLKIVFESTAGERKVLLQSLPVLAGEVIDATVMQAANLRAFLVNALARAKAEDVLFSVHLKATMMKVSDPIIFGHVVKAYFADVFEKYGDDLAAAGLSANDGLGAILAGLPSLPNGAEIRAAFEAALAAGPRLSYVNSDKGITNLHVPSDVIVDASMPALIRNGGKLWGADGAEDDTLAVIPDSSYAGVYATVIEDVKRNGPLDPATIGTVPNVGLMAQAAEEYGSHNKTFEIPADGTVTVVNQAGEVLLAHDVEAGDIWRACQTKDIPVRDWVKLAVTRARAAQTPAIFWLDESRAHDAELIKKVNAYLPEHDTAGLEIQILAPELATAYSLERMRQGLDTISVTGNVLRDYNTDLFPILEVGTSAKMLSDRAADRGRRPVRDRRRRLRPQARAAARPGELPALGLARRVLRAGARPSSSTPTSPACRARRCWPTRSTGRPARSSTRTAARAAGSARSTTAARTSTWRCTGPRSWPGRPTTPSSPRRSRGWPRRWPRRRPSSSRSCSRSRASPPTSAATTCPTPRRPRP